MFHRCIKICGLKTPDAVSACIQAGADMIGLVFFDKSPRYISVSAARTLVCDTPASLCRVGLFVDPDDDWVQTVMANVALDCLQVHNVLDPMRIRALRDMTQKPVYVSVGLTEANDLLAARRFYDVADGILFDAKPPVQSDNPGGLGQVFDWSILHNFSCHKPWLLAGGLTPDTVIQAIQSTGVSGIGAPGVDVSSGVESALGVKDPEKIQSFIAAVRSV